MTNEAKYIPQVGDRVRLHRWPQGEWLDVLGVGECRFFARAWDGDEWSWPLDLDDPWIKVEPRPTVREHWGVVDPDLYFDPYLGENAERWARSDAQMVGYALARIAAVTVTDDHVGQVWPVVCDEHREPLGVEVRE